MHPAIREKRSLPNFETTPLLLCETPKLLEFQHFFYCITLVIDNHSLISHFDEALI